MNSTTFDFSTISDSELTPLVRKLLSIIGQQAAQIQQQAAQIQQQAAQIQRQSEQIDVLKEEIAKLKGLKGRPKIAPSRLNDKKRGGTVPPDGKRPGSEKHSKKISLEIDETIKVPPVRIPPGSRYLGTREYDVQDLIIKTHNIRYLLEEWLTPDGSYISGEPPEDGRQGHFGANLVAFIMYQHHQCHVTQPLLHEQLQEFGVDISAGQVSNFLTEDLDAFHVEKDEILKAGLEVSSYVQVDDTGARHDGKNGYCTSIGNDQFAWYGSTGSKSRINFLELLSAGKVSYRLSDDAFRYMAEEKLSKLVVKCLRRSTRRVFKSRADWLEHLGHLGVSRTGHVRLVTEAALYGALLATGFNSELVILSDDAGQFNVPLQPHALCWIHAERAIKRLVPMNDRQREDQAEIADAFWRLYRDLKDYKEKPQKRRRQQIERSFDSLFQRRTSFESLNLALRRIHTNRVELLMVLDHPELPLHNNSAETDIREYVKRRKVSGGTRSECGQRSRDTFTSLKKTCRKLQLSFWHYLKDRLAEAGEIAYLPALIRNLSLVPAQAAAS
jgi:hypothetical protein